MTPNTDALPPLPLQAILDEFARLPATYNSMEESFIKGARFGERAALAAQQGAQVPQVAADERADAARFRWLCAHPDWHFIEHLCREFVADGSMEFLTELRRVIDARRSIDLSPFELHLPASPQAPAQRDDGITGESA